MLLAITLDPTIMATAIVTVITALTASSIMIINALAALRTKMDVVATKTAVIEGHVNSQKTADAAMIASLRREIELKQQMLDEKDRVAGLLAQAAAVAKGVVQPAAPSV